MQAIVFIDEKMQRNRRMASKSKSPAQKSKDKEKKDAIESSQTTSKKPIFSIKGQYLKKVDFLRNFSEKPSKDSGPTNIDISCTSKEVSPHFFEVSMNINVKIGKNDPNPSKLEFIYNGQFQLENIPIKERNFLLSVECPRLLLPYVQRIASDIARDAGFLNFSIPSIDFMQAYINSAKQSATTSADK